MELYYKNSEFYVPIYKFVYFVDILIKDQKMDLQVIFPLLYHFLYFLSFLQLPEVCIIFINQKEAKVFFLLRRMKIEHVWTFLLVCKSPNVGTQLLDILYSLDLTVTTIRGNQQCPASSRYR